MGTSMLLTVALRATPSPQLHYQLDQIVQFVDWINLMSYDYVREYAAKFLACSALPCSQHV